MARFNNATPSNKTINYAGGEAYQQSPKMEFVSILLTSFVADQYYRGSKDTVKRLQELMGLVEPEFAAKAAIYARTKFGMRSVSHVIAGELATRVYGEPWKTRFYDKIVFRPDDMTEILSYYYGLRDTAGLKRTEPNSMKRGFAKALKRFNAYQIAKYRGEGKAVSLVDIANIAHPAHSQPIEGLIKGTLKNTDTWEAKLTGAGQKATTDEEKAELKEQAWRDLLTEGKLPHFALLRNLRNIVQQAPELVDLAAKQLTNEQIIKKSLVLPFRYFTAYIEMAGENGPAARKMLRALTDALDIACSNMPDFGGRSLVVVDHSGSMDSQMSDKSKATNFQVGALFGLALAKATNADLMYFGDIAKYYNVTGDSVMGQLKWLEKCNTESYGYGSYGRQHSGDAVGHGTNFQEIFKTANQPYDRVFIFSDMQAWQGYNVPTREFADYKKRTNTDPRVFAFDLSGYGSLQFPERNIYQVAGFSDKIFDVLKLLEQDRNALISEIEKVEV